MSILVRAGKNIFFKAVGELLSRFIYMFFFVYLARKLGSGDFGLFSFAFSFAGIFGVLLDPGLNMLAINDIAKDRGLAKIYAGNFMSIKSLMAAVVFFMIWAVIRAMGYDERTVDVVLLMAVFIFLNCFIDFYVSLADGHEKMALGAAFRVANKSLVAILGMAALLLACGLERIIVYMIGGSALSVIASHVLVRLKVTEIGLSFDPGFMRTIVPRALPVALTMIFSIIYFKVDVVMLSMLKVPNDEIGLYSSTTKLIEILNVVPAITVGGVFPILAATFQSSRPKMERLLEKTYQGLFILVIPVILTVSFFSREVVSLIYGEGYVGAAPVLRVVIWSSLLLYLNVLLVNVIIIANRQVLNAVFALVCLTLNIALNLVMIPRLGIMGAGIATVVTNALLLSLNTLFIVRLFKGSGFLQYNVKPLACAILALAVSVLIKGAGLYLYLLLITGIYVIIVFVTRVFSREDIRMIREALLPNK